MRMNRFYRVSSLTVFALLIVCSSSPGGEPEGDRWALIIGINDYQHVGTLNYCRQDAEALKGTLVEEAGFSPRRVVMLTDDVSHLRDLATEGNIRGGIEQFAQLAGEEDTVLVYFAGHGITLEGQDYLLPVDGRRKAESAVPVEWVKSRLEKCKAKTRLLVLDMCRPGSERAVGSVSLDLKAKRGLTVFTSCRPGQTSHEEAGRGVFSRYFGRGLEGKADADEDGAITQVELYSYVKEKMTDWSLDSRKTQIPQVYPSSEELLARPVTKIPRSRMKNQRRDQDRKNDSEIRISKAESDRQVILDLGDGVRMKLVRIPAGEFIMGSKLTAEEVAERYGGRIKNFGDEQKPRKLQIRRPFYMSATEVTIGQYRQFLRDGGDASGIDWKADDCPLRRQEHYVLCGDGLGISLDQPMVGLSWNGARKFCEWLTSKTDFKVDLPTEAQWEYACRAGSEAPYCFGANSSKLSQYAWYKGNSAGRTHEVAQLNPNSWGLFDMHGNAWEWCLNPVWRGGGFMNGPYWQRSACRRRPVSVMLDYLRTSVGFRVVLSLSAE